MFILIFRGGRKEVDVLIYANILESEPNLASLNIRVSDQQD